MNISCKDGLDKGQKWYAPNRSRRYYHQVNGHEFEQTPRDSEGQGSLACSSSWDCKESDMTE